MGYGSTPSIPGLRDGVTGGSAANALAAEADAILLIGTRLSHFTTASRTLFRNLERHLILLNIAAYVISTYE
jgi:3D-(3,5/4)-trihydroxycyclohexane-1,2-dione acylhydrolase (decyclizing)